MTSDPQTISKAARLPADLVDKIDALADYLAELDRSGKPNFSRALVFVLREAEDRGLLEVPKPKKKWMAKNWNELQDEGPLEVRVKRLTAAPGQHCADAKAAIQSACASVTKPCCRCSSHEPLNLVCSGWCRESSGLAVCDPEPSSRLQRGLTRVAARRLQSTGRVVIGRIAQALYTTYVSAGVPHLTRPASRQT